VRLSHAPARTRVTFDDPALVARAGLAPVTGLAERAGLHGLSGARPPGRGSAWRRRDNHGRRESERPTARR
jgi:hypothetical protein